MPNRNLSRLAPLTGVLFAVLTFVSFIVAGEPPGADEDPAEIVEFYADNEGPVILGAILASLAGVALIFFAATVRRALRRTEREMGVLSLAAFGGGVVTAAGYGVDSALRFTLADQAEDLQPESVQAIQGLWETFFFPMVIGMATLILAVSIAAIATRVIPNWLGWIGILIAIVFFTPAGFAAFLASMVWVVVLSVLLWRKEPAVGTAPV